jgi:glucose/arabinose dehydrogenase
VYLLQTLSPSKIFLITILVLCFIIPSYQYWYYQAYAEVTKAPASSVGPTINDPTLRVELVFKGLKKPTTMAFLGPNDILVLEKNEGTVKRIVNGTMLPQPVLDVNVANEMERGMLGIAVAPKHENKPIYVFLYYTESQTKDGDDITEQKQPLGNRLYKYEFLNGKLVNPKLLLDLPAKERAFHNGGVIAIGSDNNLYFVAGSVASDKIASTSFGPDNGKILNIKDGPEPDGRGGILRITQDGQVLKGMSVLGNKDPLNKYYAYGIRNSFGIDFDPITGKLWDTENGPTKNDEINLIEPGFNSGWKLVNGMFSNGNKFDLNDLEDFGGKGKYSDPEFAWNHTVAPTAIKFLNSDKLGKRYENDLFVGDFNNGNLYHFDLNKKRNELSLKGLLHDKTASDMNELQKEHTILGQGFGGISGKGDIIYETGFGGISDIKESPDGYLYIISMGQGAIYRVAPVTN